MVYGWAQNELKKSCEVNCSEIKSRTPVHHFNEFLHNFSGGNGTDFLNLSYSLAFSARKSGHLITKIVRYRIQLDSSQKIFLVPVQQLIVEGKDASV